MFLSYFGIRVTNLEKSLDFYTRLFGLKEAARGDNAKLGGGTYVLLKDQFSGQKLELNYYPPTSPHAVPYSSGEGLDHIAFKVTNVPIAIRELISKGVELAYSVPKLGSPIGNEITDMHLVYVKDPDGTGLSSTIFRSKKK